MTDAPIGKLARRMFTFVRGTGCWHQGIPLHGSRFEVTPGLSAVLRAQTIVGTQYCGAPARGCCERLVCRLFGTVWICGAVLFRTDCRTGCYRRLGTASLDLDLDLDPAATVVEERGQITSGLRGKRPEGEVPGRKFAALFSSVYAPRHWLPGAPRRRRIHPAGRSSEPLAWAAGYGMGVWPSNTRDTWVRTHRSPTHVCTYIQRTSAPTGGTGVGKSFALARQCTQAAIEGRK